MKPWLSSALLLLSCLIASAQETQTTRHRVSSVSNLKVETLKLQQTTTVAYTQVARGKEVLLTVNSMESTAKQNGEETRNLFISKEMFREKKGNRTLELSYSQANSAQRKVLDLFASPFLQCEV